MSTIKQLNTEPPLLGALSPSPAAVSPQLRSRDIKFLCPQHLQISCLAVEFNLQRKVKRTATQSCGWGMNENIMHRLINSLCEPHFLKSNMQNCFTSSFLCLVPLADCARHLATLLIVLVYSSRPRHSQSSAQLSRVRGRGRAWCRYEPPSTTLLLNASLSWCATAEQEWAAEAGLAMMARWEAEWWWWVRCSAATNFDLYAAPSSETEVSPASNSFHSL